MDNSVKIYLSAPISGVERNMVEQTFAQMEGAARRWCRRNKIEHYEIINPADIVAPDTSWPDAIIRDLQLLRDCDIIVTHRDWQISVGCAIERAFAQRAGITIENIDDL